ncbi:MAG: CCA tRNA nucleotidyltransferase, partial [Nitrospiraceae bacterium]
MLAIHPDIQPIFERLCRLIRETGGRPLLVGGCVRDLLLSSRPSDLDLEVYELAPQQLIDVLGSAFDIDLVGQSFGVIKLHHYPIDISLPRRESKVGMGHRGFEVLSDPWMSLEEAAARRDFTMNAMAIDPATEELLDPFNGQRDLKLRILRHTSPQFAEDPLRVLRGMQFISRFELTPAPETLALCRGLFHEYPTLTPERIWGEWEKWATWAVHPSLGLRFLQEIGWTAMYPELVALQGCPQDPAWHPEGDVWTHTLLVVDQAAQIAVREGLEGHERAVLLLAALCHDLGKPSTTAVIDGHIRSPGHAECADPVSSFLDKLGTSKELATRIMGLVRHHLSHLQFDG